MCSLGACRHRTTGAAASVHPARFPSGSQPASFKLFKAPRTSPLFACCAANQVIDLRTFTSYAAPLKAALSVGVLATLAYALRPHGWCNTELVKVEASTIDRQGVFAQCFIPAGTVIGSYPGFARPPAEMARKVQRHPGTKDYVFSVDGGWFLDPTDGQGRMHQSKLWGIVQPHLAFVNEPVAGQVTNLSVEQGKGRFQLLYVAVTDINASEELLIDYGVHYDRTGYARTKDAEQ